MDGWGSASEASGVYHQAQPWPHLIEDHGPNDACGSRLRGEWSLPSYHPFAAFPIVAAQAESACHTLGLTLPCGALYHAPL